MKARQVAWLAATPKDHKVSRWEAIETHNKRIEDRLLDESDESPYEAPKEINLPDVDAEFSHLWELFQFSGYSQQTGMGLVALNWQELRAFRLENQLNLTLFERRCLKEMSEAYCREYSLATDPKRPAPFAPEEEAAQQVLQQAFGLRSLIRSKSVKKETK